MLRLFFILLLWATASPAHIPFSPYDAGGLLLTVTESGQTLTRTYDGLGRLENYTI